MVVFFVILIEQQRVMRSYERRFFATDYLLFATDL